MLTTWSSLRAALACLSLLACARAGAAAGGEAAAPAPANPAAVQELPQVTVIANAPLPGFGLPLEQVATNVQTADSQDLKRAQATGIADYLSRAFTGVNVNESAANPLQLDINYHGFTASPLLGTPEGLSVYLDGVRVNESFGDTVNWDLIPESSIATVSLIAGSNPVFGLNTLGGALSIQTKSGHDFPGSQLEAYAGSFGRRVIEGETGGERGPFDYFLTVKHFDEDGWRDLSGSRVWQAFGKAGWQTDNTDLDLSYTYADTGLSGNGVTPLSLLAYRRQQSYTPDFTHNLLHFVNLTGSQSLAPHLLLTGNAYYRRLATSSNNVGNNDSYLDESYAGPPIDCGVPPDGPAALAFCAPATSQLGALTQRTSGFGLQLTDSHDLHGGPNQAILGFDYRSAADEFAQALRYGAFSPQRTLIYQVTPLNDQTVIALRGDNRLFGVYFTDTWSPRPLLHVTASARYNHSRQSLGGHSVDTHVGDFGAGFDEAAPLTGEHAFARLNPAVGLTLTPDAALTWYADYNEANRAPTVVELGCANPARPCGLPNDFAGDPTLAQVVAHTVEVGVRRNSGDLRLRWSADLFRTVNSDDIQFIATSTNAGYFANVGNTRRQGLDLAAGGRSGGFNWTLSYSLTDATFQSAFEVSAASNSSADAAGNILVRPGDRIPLVPRHTGKLLLDYQLGERLDIGGSLVVASGSYLHGNENNANRAGATNGSGALILGSGWIPGYAVVNLQATWQAAPHWEVFARIANLLDRRYATAGFLTRNSFTPAGVFRADPADWTQENAVSPGAPRALWAGVRLHTE